MDMLLDIDKMYVRRSLGSFLLFMSVFVMLSRLIFVALWSPAGRGLTSWLLFVMFNCFDLILYVH